MRDMTMANHIASYLQFKGLVNAPPKPHVVPSASEMQVTFSPNNYTTNKYTYRGAVSSPVVYSSLQYLIEKIPSKILECVA